MAKSEDHAAKAENALEEALQHLRDALKHTERRDKGSYEQALAYVVRSAMPAIGLAEQELRLARDAATVEERNES